MSTSCQVHGRHSCHLLQLLTIVYCYFCGHHETLHAPRSSILLPGNHFVALGGGGGGGEGGVSSGHKLGAYVQNSIKRLPPFFFAKLQCKRGGGYNRVSTVHVCTDNRLEAHVSLCICTERPRLPVIVRVLSPNTSHFQIAKIRILVHMNIQRAENCYRSSEHNAHVQLGMLLKATWTLK